MNSRLETVAEIFECTWKEWKYFTPRYKSLNPPGVGCRNLQDADHPVGIADTQPNWPGIVNEHLKILKINAI